MRLTMHCEINEARQRILKRRWPGALIYPDVRTFLRQDSRVRPIRLPHMEPTMLRAFGPRPCRSFDHFDPFGLYLKTCLDTGFRTLSELAVTSRIATMPSGRLILVLRSEKRSGGVSTWWPTPTRTANHNAPSMRKHPAYKRLQNAGGANPSRWEWMMGFPRGWTVCEPWETASESTRLKCSSGQL